MEHVEGSAHCPANRLRREGIRGGRMVVFSSSLRLVSRAPRLRLCPRSRILPLPLPPPASLFDRRRFLDRKMSRACWKATREKLLETFSQNETLVFAPLLAYCSRLNRWIDYPGLVSIVYRKEDRKKKKKRSLWYWNRWIKHGIKRDEKNDLFEIKWNVTSREIVLEVIFRILFISVRISLSIRERIIIWISRCLQSRACKMWKKELSLHLYLHSCNMDFIQRNWHVKQKLIQK